MILALDKIAKMWYNIVKILERLARMKGEHK